jgi:DNA-binding transcriptional LysR family regulator
VRLVAFPSGSASLVPMALAALAREHPGVRASFVEDEPPEALAVLGAGDADVALVFAYPEAGQDLPAHLEAEELLQDPLLACLPPGHPAAAGGGPVELASLAEDPWIATCERCRAHLLHAAGHAGFAPRIVHETDDAACVHGLVAAGLGVALLPALALQGLRRSSVEVRPLRRPVPRTVLAVAPAPPRPPAVQALLAALRGAAAAWRADGRT